MSKTIFIFIATVFLLVPVIYAAGSITTGNQLLLCSPFLLFFGISHGAIDNILYLRDRQMNNMTFIGGYLIFVGLNIIFWIIYPEAALLSFLLLSAYHFGQSQFSHYFEKQPILHKTFFLVWGICVLSGLFFFNTNEIQQIIYENNEFSVLRVLQQETTMQVIFYSSMVITCFYFLYFVVQKSFSAEVLFMEILVMALIILCFFLMPLLIGFTLYFVILHSVKVLREEYKFLTAEKFIFSIPQFVRLVFPFTMLSVLGIGFLFGLIYFQLLPFSYGYCLLIIISSITLPHVFVMHNFYNLLFSKNYYKSFT